MVNQVNNDGNRYISCCGENTVTGAESRSAPHRWVELSACAHWTMENWKPADFGKGRRARKDRYAELLRMAFDRRAEDGDTRASEGKITEENESDES